MTSPADHTPPGAPGRPKAEARRDALAARDALSAADRARLSRLVCARVTGLPEVRAAEVVMSFATFRSEIDTTPLAEWVLARGKTLCLPRVLGPRRMAAFRVDDLESDLEPGAWDIPEPRPGLQEVPPEAIDVVLVPGAAFDLDGRRCGYGGGFYDSFLPRTRSAVPRIALAFEVQLVERLDCEAHDLPVTAIVTESRVIAPA